MNKDESPIYVVYDLETGGMSEIKNPIMEIAMVPVIYDKQNKCYKKDEENILSGLVKKYKNLIIEETAMKINGITLEDLKKNGNDIKDVLEAIKDLAKELNPTGKDKLKPILVGHNIMKFDNRFLQKAFRFYNDNLYNYFSEACIDTYTLSLPMFAGNEQIMDHTLGNIIAYTGIEKRKAHRSLDDALMNADLFIAITKLLNIDRRKTILDINKS